MSNGRKGKVGNAVPANTTQMKSGLGQGQHAASPARPVKRVSSLPSQEAYVVDVPEVKNLRAQFDYHYFVPDESVSETNGVPARFMQRAGETFDASTLDLMGSRVPRMVSLSFTPAVSLQGTITAERQKEIAAAVGQTGHMIADNITKIVSEDEFSSGRFVTVTFHDGEIDDKLYELVSGSYAQIMLEQDDDDMSHYRAAAKLADRLPLVDREFITSNMTRAAAAHGTRFFPEKGTNSYVAGGHASIGLQIGAKFVHDVIERAVVDPNSHFSADMQPLMEISRKIQGRAKMLSNTAVTDDDYKTFTQYVKVRAAEANHMPIAHPAKIVGYIIDRQEAVTGGTVVSRDPIIIENPAVGTTVDLRVKYGAAYTYTVRTIASFVFPAVDDETGEIVTVTALVSSRPSSSARVICTEEIAPPPPADMGFTWNHDTERMMVHWTFPPNPQRDVKRFQVFRRRTLLEPFELIRMYDFDDSQASIAQRENPDPSLIERMTSPRTWFVDEEFTRDTRFMYAVGSVDAHGNVSPYSAQFLVWFDRFKNRLMTRAVSHFGAPRQYPNMYLEADTFVDTIRDVGHHRLNLYFTPECYALHDDANKSVPAIVSDRDGGSYRLQFINPDAQKMGVVDVTLNDLRSSATSK